VGVSEGTTRESPADEEESRVGGIRTGGGVEGGRGVLAQDKVESEMVSETNPEVVRQYLDICTLRKRKREVGGEGVGHGTGKEDREGETGAEGRTSDAGGTETADQVEGGALDSKEEGWGADSISTEDVKSGAGWETTGEKYDLMIVWLEEVAGCCCFFLCCFGLRERGEV